MSHLCKFALHPVPQQCQAVPGAHCPDGCQQNEGQEVHNMRQTGLFCLGGGREIREDGEKNGKGKVKVWDIRKTQNLHRQRKIEEKVLGR